jgi:hypothetical protein
VAAQPLSDKQSPDLAAGFLGFGQFEGRVGAQKIRIVGVLAAAGMAKMR